MRRGSLPGLTLLAVILLMPVALTAQEQHAHVTQDQLTVFAKAYTAISQRRDQAQAEFAAPKNKKTEAQDQLHEKLRLDIAKIIQDHGLTEDQYKRITYAVSTDLELRKSFDLLMGIAPPAPPPAAASGSAAGARTHIGHVMESFNGTPDRQGLLPTALAEAGVVVQHAGLAAKNTTDLDAMKLHAGHILHALEPTEGSMGPGAGYGLKKAAAAVATHIDLAARTEGASQNVTTHANHIATSAKNTLKRAEQIGELAKQIQAASSASAAAALVNQLNTLANQLIAGADANGDGKISWEDGEGGLTAVETHLGLLVKAEAK
jgi:hypothetical protein